MPELHTKTAYHRRKPAEVAHHRATIADRYLRGDLQSAIAADLGIDQATVSRDLAVLQAEWQARAAATLDTAKAAELARIDALERTYWVAWESSRTDLKRTTTEGRKGTDGTPIKDRAAVATQTRDGNPAFLAGVQWCIDRRCRLLGIDAPVKQEHSGLIQTQIVTADDLAAARKRAQEYEAALVTGAPRVEN